MAEAPRRTFPTGDPTAPAGDGPSADRQTRVIVVDDNDATRYAIRRLLQRQGFEVVEATTGRDALERIGQGADLVILDVNLPDMDGFAISRAVRADDRIARLPILQVSATSVDASSQIAGLEAGADAYLPEPVDPAVLLATIRALLRASRAEEAVQRRSSELARALEQQQVQALELARVSEAESAARKLVEGVVEQMPIGVIVAEAPSGDVLVGNGEIDRIWRNAPDGSATPGRPPLGSIFHADGRPYEPEEWPLVRSLRDGEIVRDEEAEIVRGDRSRGTISISSTPVRSADGTIAAAVATIIDISRRREAEILRDAFIGILSHELRTPITSIYGGSKVLLRERSTLAEETQREILADLAGESERLHRLVENLLVLARVERGVQITGQEPVLLQRLLPKFVAEEARQWPELTIELRSPDDLPTVSGDESFIDQVLRNLLSNAAKYGPPDGTVTIEVEAGPDDAEVRVRVLDEGVGIDDEEASQLFDLFFRSANVQKKAAGSGIGLFVSHNLVAGMGGRMWARGRPEGGSEFGFALRNYDLVEDRR